MVDKHDCAKMEEDLAYTKHRIKELEDAIKNHRAQKADDRCIDDDDVLYATFGDGIKCDRRVGSKEEMLKNCSRFIDRRCQQGHWPTYAELEAKINSVVPLADYMQRLILNDEPGIENAALDLMRAVIIIGPKRDPQASKATT